MRGWKELEDMIWPRRCVVCGKILDVDECHLCAECLADMPLTYFWSWRNNPAERILWGRTYLENVVSLFFYSRDNDYKELLHAVKYGGDMQLGRWLGSILGRYMRDIPALMPDFIVPVPLHWRRKWKRGYNQAEVIAGGLAEALGGLRVETGLLRRTGYSKSQTRMQTGNKWENVSGSFSLSSEADVDKLRGAHVMLVDDVLTTGATVEACWDVLSLVPDVRVSYASIAFVQHPV
ncbi:MAG TPA: ComF family protein [Candidatus Coprenecus stercoravium]|uniref:ComF family protein n=1 Tax=Candidatus Coprenecus stercoravium TaxID=2840735 RepID=A0A9D2KAE2_9BACT|nr:ComF family protein [Candidatus Coprenecus stercoravium]